MPLLQHHAMVAFVPRNDERLRSRANLLLIGRAPLGTSATYLSK